MMCYSVKEKRKQNTEIIKGNLTIKYTAVQSTEDRSTFTISRPIYQPPKAVFYRHSYLLGQPFRGRMLVTIINSIHVPNKMVSIESVSNVSLY
uniref:Uncharacterized protein n=1 Tax=Pyxicephalus adspersus TaxID=30357 RepID=A0AAV3AAS8_PYXAD|nr:TPA: hypothetical protein GDO54_011993 [Pyxicephalus adspersus]